MQLLNIGRVWILCVVPDTVVRRLNEHDAFSPFVSLLNVKKYKTKFSFFVFGIFWILFSFQLTKSLFFVFTYFCYSTLLQQQSECRLINIFVVHLVTTTFGIVAVWNYCLSHHALNVTAQQTAYGKHYLSNNVKQYINIQLTQPMDYFESMSESTTCGSVVEHPIHTPACANQRNIYLGHRFSEMQKFPLPCMENLLEQRETFDA